MGVAVVSKTLHFEGVSVIAFGLDSGFCLLLTKEVRLLGRHPAFQRLSGCRLEYLSPWSCRQPEKVS